jgi:hypothetical protein
MSLWKRFRNSLSGPMHVEGEDDPEVEADLAEEMPEAAEDAEEASESDSIMTRGGVRVTPDPTLPPARTMAFEGEQAEEAEKDAEASDHAS